MKELDYELLKEEVWSYLKCFKEVVLSTSYKDYVTSRTVYCFFDEGGLYFITSKAYTKYKQLIQNSRVSVCRDHIQLEGIAEDRGHPDANNIQVADEEMRDYISQYARYKNTTLIKISITKATIYKGKGLYHYLLIEDKKAFSKGIERT